MPLQVEGVATLRVLRVFTLPACGRFALVPFRLGAVAQRTSVQVVAMLIVLKCTSAV